MNPKYTQVAALLSELIVAEMTTMRNEAQRIQIRPHSDTASSDEYIGLQREKCINLRNARDTVEAIASGFAGCDHDEPEQQITGQVFSINLEELFGSEGAGLVGKKEESKAPPAENKAQSAAYEALKREAMGQTGAGASVGGSAADFRTSGEANG